MSLSKLSGTGIKRVFTISELENEFKSMLNDIHKLQGDRNNQIYFDGSTWGYIVDGSFSNGMSFDKLKSRMEEYVKFYKKEYYEEEEN